MASFSARPDCDFNFFFLSIKWGMASMWVNLLIKLIVCTGLEADLGTRSLRSVWFVLLNVNGNNGCLFHNVGCLQGKWRAQGQSTVLRVCVSAHASLYDLGCRVTLPETAEAIANNAITDQCQYALGRHWERGVCCCRFGHQSPKCYKMNFLTENGCAPDKF